MAFRNKTNRSFKAGIDTEDCRRKRADGALQLRKKTRDEQLQKRRMKTGDTTAVPNNENNPNLVNITNQTAANTLATVDSGKLSLADIQEKLKNLPVLVSKVTSENGALQLEGVQEFRKLLSIEKNPPIQEVINTGIVPRLVQMLTFVHNEALQFEAAWTLTNIASGTTEHTQVVINNNGIPMFIQLLGSPNPEVKEQAVWALGNIAGDSASFRDLVTQAGGVRALCGVFTDDAKIGLIRNATWTLSNLCRGKPQPNFESVKEFLPILSKLIMFDDTEILTDTCWALSYISDDNGPENKKIQSCVDHGVIPHLVKCLKHRQTSVQTPALRAIGNIVTGDDSQTNAVLQANPLPSLVGMMTHPKKTIRKEACWTISNITAGHTDQISAVINQNCIPPLISLLKNDDFDIQKEAAWAISNATSGGDAKQMHYLVSQQAIPALCELFSCKDTKIVMVALDGIDNLLKVSKKEGEATDSVEWSMYVEECGGLDSLEELQNHSNEEVYKKAMGILKEYFDSEEEEEDATLGMDAAANQFTFAASNPQALPSGGFHF